MTQWTLTPVASVLMLAATVGYGAAVLICRRRGRPWPMAQIICWVAAMVVLTTALNSPLARYSVGLFWAHMTVHLLMITVAPALLVAAQPIRLWRTASSGGQSARIDRIVSGRFVRISISPAVTVPLYTAVLVGTHLTGFAQVMTHTMWIHHAELVLYLVSGYLLLLPLLGNELAGRHLAFPLRFAVLMVCMVPDAIVGVALMMTDRIVAPGYGQLRIGWGPAAAADQTAAGASRCGSAEMG